MTSLRFVGHLPWWAGAVLALLAALVAWRLYRRERHDLPGRLRWLLPGLRAVAVFLVVLTLIGPVLHHRQVIGQLGRVLLLVDGSQSMGVADQHMPVARKLLIAQTQGWLPDAQIDLALWESATMLTRVRDRVAAGLDEPRADRAALDALRRDFAEGMDQAHARAASFNWQLLTDAANPAGAGPASDLMERLRSELVEPARRLLDSSLDRSEANEEVAAALGQLCDRAARLAAELRAAFDGYGEQLRQSGTPGVLAALNQFDQSSRWSRAAERLLGGRDRLLPALAGAHDVELWQLTGAMSARLWTSRSGDAAPTALTNEPIATVTDLAGPLASVSAEISAEQRSAVVLLTDGRHNTREMPLEIARGLGERGLPIYTVGYGADREPSDLAVLDVECPRVVFQKDRVRGAVVLKDQMEPGTSFLLQIGFGDTVLWQQQLATQDTTPRRVEFAFPIDAVVETLMAGMDTTVKQNAVTVALQVSIAPLEGETDVANNTRTVRVKAITQGYKLLLIDGRARWETRYLRNVFERDEQWEIDTILAGPGSDLQTLPRGDSGQDTFPDRKSGLDAYDLIILGELPISLLSDTEWSWVREFVEKRGGGLIFVDGQRQYLRQVTSEAARSLLPVTWSEQPLVSQPTRLELTASGKTQDWLMLQTTGSANEQFWRELPAPHRVVPVEALPGTEVLVETVVDGKPYPAVVTRSFGAGRVLYFAFDETWRWRYKVADTYHQRFWNQAAKWVMPEPFAISDAYVSLDAGAATYRAGQQAEIRVQLRTADGDLAENVAVDGLVWQDGRLVSVVALAADPSGNGVYRGQSAPLIEGTYEISVRAAGFSNEALRARTSFVVEPPSSPEMLQLACNEDLLGEMATSSRGHFLREEQIGTLQELLRPLSTGQIRESDTILWQSYWWFGAIVLLLAGEWLVRKRAGLL